MKRGRIDMDDGHIFQAKQKESFWKMENWSCVRSLTHWRHRKAVCLLFCINIFPWESSLQNGWRVCSPLTDACWWVRALLEVFMLQWIKNEFVIVFPRQIDSQPSGEPSAKTSKGTKTTVTCKQIVNVMKLCSVSFEGRCQNEDLLGDVIYVYRKRHKFMYKPHSQLLSTLPVLFTLSNINIIVWRKFTLTNLLFTGGNAEVL